LRQYQKAIKAIGTPHQLFQSLRYLHYDYYLCVEAILSCFVHFEQSDSFFQQATQLGSLILFMSN